MLENGEEDDEQLINIKLNEDILAEKNTKIKIKLFTFQKNDLIGVIDSLELKSRYFTIECTSDNAVLDKIRIFDFIVFIASNHGLDLQNITGLSSVQISISLELKMPFPDEAQACSDYFTENIYKKGKTFNNGFIKK